MPSLATCLPLPIHCISLLLILLFWCNMQSMQSDVLSPYYDSFWKKGKEKKNAWRFFRLVRSRCEWCHTYRLCHLQFELIRKNNNGHQSCSHYILNATAPVKQIDWLSANTWVCFIKKKKKKKKNYQLMFSRYIGLFYIFGFYHLFWALMFSNY